MENNEDNSLNGLLSLLSSNPDIMGKAQQMAQMIKEQSKENEIKHEDNSLLIPTELTNLKIKKEDRVLLNAIKPYLPEKKRERVEQALKVFQWVEIAQSINKSKLIAISDDRKEE